MTGYIVVNFDHQFVNSGKCYGVTCDADHVVWRDYLTAKYIAESAIRQTGNLHIKVLEVDIN